MQADRIGGGCVASPNQTEDLRDQRIVLSHVLALEPTYVIVPELVREITAGADEYAEGDRVERAIRDLNGVGLLNCHGPLVLPSRAAGRFDLLMVP